MADIVRVKAKKNFEWDQDNKYVFVRIPMPGHTTIKNIEIYLSDLILRITSKQKKSAETLDLLKEVEYLSPENKFVLSDGIVSATLKKKIPN
jgi:HSP20 family molecular chaperone IbpA